MAGYREILRLRSQVNDVRRSAAADRSSKHIVREFEKLADEKCIG